MVVNPKVDNEFLTKFVSATVVVEEEEGSALDSCEDILSLISRARLI